MYGGLSRETGHAHRLDLSNHTITPEELEGLESVLRLTETVADQVTHSTYTAVYTIHIAVKYNN